MNELDGVNVRLGDGTKLKSIMLRILVMLGMFYAKQEIMCWKQGKWGQECEG